MSKLFHKIDAAQVILRSKGIYRQVDVYVREDRLFARWGGGFIGLVVPHGGTTLPAVSWDHIEGVEYVEGPHGRMHRKVERKGR